MNEEMKKNSISYEENLKGKEYENKEMFEEE